MSCTKIENALKTVLPDAVYKVQAPETTNDGEPLLRYLVWTPTGDRYAYANSRPFATIYQAVVTVATQTEDDTLPAEVVKALADAHIAMQMPEHSYDVETASYYTDIPCEVI